MLGFFYLTQSRSVTPAGCSVLSYPCWCRKERNRRSYLFLVIPRNKPIKFSSLCGAPWVHPNAMITERRYIGECDALLTQNFFFFCHLQHKDFHHLKSSRLNVSFPKFHVTVYLWKTWLQLSKLTAGQTSGRLSHGFKPQLDSLWVIK